MSHKSHPCPSRLTAASPATVACVAGNLPLWRAAHKEPPAAGASAAPSSIYDFTAPQREQDVPLSTFKDQVLIIVNVASE